MAENTFIKSEMKRLPIVLISLILLCSFGCGSKHPSIESDPLAQYRDTLVGNFNGTEIDTLICELADTLPISYRYKIHSLNNTVLSLAIENANIPMRLVNEGDLDGNGTDEFGVRRETDAGTWNNYCVYTYDNGEWKYLIEPIWTYSDHFYADLNKGADVVERANQSGYVTVRFSDIRNDDLCIVDTLMPIAPHPITNQE